MGLYHQIHWKLSSAQEPYFIHQIVLGDIRVRHSEAATEAERASYFGRVLDSSHLCWGAWSVRTGKGKQPQYMMIIILIVFADTECISSLKLFLCCLHTLVVCTYSIVRQLVSGSHSSPYVE